MSSNENIQRVRCTAVTAALLILLGACPSVADDGVAEEGAATRASSVAAGQAELPQGELTLRDALALALERSPDLAAFAWEIRAREARAQQAALLPNPTFSAEVENIGGSGPRDGVESAETTLLLSQLIELGGKRSKRRSVGAFEAKVAEWDYEAARLAVVAETTGAFVGALAQQQGIALADERVRLSEDVLRAVQAQVRSGAVSSAQMLRADLEVTKQQIERRLMDRALRAAYVRLATAWGASDPTFSLLAGDLAAVSPIPLEAELLQRMATTPELARWQAEVTKRRAAIELQNAQRIPDVTVALGPRHFEDSNDWALVVGVQLPLPVFDRNQGSRRALKSQLSKSREEQRSTELRLRRALAHFYQGLASAYEEVTALTGELIPKAERAYEATKNAEKQGALRFTEVFDAQGVLFALRAQLLEAQASYHLSRAQTEALIGGPLAVQKDSRR